MTLAALSRRAGKPARTAVRHDGMSMPLSPKGCAGLNFLGKQASSFWEGYGKRVDSVMKNKSF